MNNLVNSTQQFCKRNASTILTCVGSVGVVATSVMAVKATPKALALLEEAKKEKGEELTKLEKVKVAGPTYIPSIAIGVSTIACVFGANAINKRRHATLISAYNFLNESYKEYKKKVEELYGEDANKNVQAEIAKDKYDKVIIQNGENKQLFYDAFSERYFESTKEDVLNAQYKLNRQIAINTGAYLNEFYEFLGISEIEAGKELGWSQGILESMYWTNWVDFHHSNIVMKDGVECCIISMLQEPVIDFAYY